MPSILIMCGDVELNPGPPKSDAAKANAEVLAAIESLASKLESRHAELMSALDAVKASQRHLENKVSDITARLAAVEMKVNSFESVPDQPEGGRSVSDNAFRGESSAHQRPIDDQDDKYRRDNLIIYGLEDIPTETWSQTEQKVRSLLSDRLSVQLSDKDIARARRIGAFVDNRCRLIVVKFASLDVRNSILSQRFKLKGTGINLQEDFSKVIRQARKKLFDFGKASGRPFNLHYNKLYSDGKCYVYCAETDAVREVEPHGVTSGPAETVTPLTVTPEYVPRLPERDYTVLFTNIRSVFNKRHALSSLIDSCLADVVVLTETWLSEKVDNGDLFMCEKQYVVYRHDRCGRLGGGILTAVSRDVTSFEVPIPSPLEFLCTCVRVNEQEAILCVCYRAPSAAASFSDDLYDCLTKVVGRYPEAPIFLLGDFNFPGILWNDPCPVVTSGSSECLSFVDMCSAFNLCQLVKEPTRVTASSANVLDLVLTTAPASVSSLTLLPGLSDHAIVHFTISPH
ncbi:hypothetical protein HPB52_022027 [Rhipicephalus sanguineus]|uniref:Endonuclease/exonuclease/phosphatase domain-containing protein n=1 Tax=Rhipicephalus sanguineus TaxID=34632 RepID=A0A9D4PSU5_RHISA|nr:hypothetical protein HPB52_022027 [Rhipicephalus sanguineus]